VAVSVYQPRCVLSTRMRKHEETHTHEKNMNARFGITRSSFHTARIVIAAVLLAQAVSEIVYGDGDRQRMLWFLVASVVSFVGLLLLELAVDFLAAICSLILDTNDDPSYHSTGKAYVHAQTVVAPSPRSAPPLLSPRYRYDAHSNRLTVPSANSFTFQSTPQARRFPVTFSTSEY
jgi:hypothetical protein